MKTFNIILLSVLVLSVASCNRKVTAAISHTTLQQDSTSTAIDTTKTTISQIIKETTNCGDTLTGNILLPTNGNAVVDSIESNGLKIKIDLIPILGGFKAHLKAIAKPTSSTKETTTIGVEQKGIATKNTNKKNIEQDTNTKATQTENELYKWIGLTLLGLGLLLLIALIIYLYLKQKQNG